MAALSEAASLMRVLAEPAVPGESVKAAIYRAARATGLPAGLCKRLWYGEARRIDADTMDQIRSAAARDRQALENAVVTRDALLARLAACEAALGLQDAHDHRPVGADAGGSARARHRPMA
ncbi:hypothetical protein ASG40_11550 [Methylobacterium sp. Leaf399]|uniref:hypothetical protein n=1 Tax=Methylobacterium sp. Leaf399 TaxID=1736364 RepID=UPI00071282A3|nr:hypothetical protein [Methylobacterium sp. Leaf399]KQT08508.1 hypothetical protein ASG40_11550 [Methylobacterium sp. Leaf399]